MNLSVARKAAAILAHALIGWALCAAIMGIGMSVTTLGTTLFIHAVGAPIIFAAISLIYFSKFNHTAPLQTAIAFVSIVIFMDVFVVALFIQRSFEMFTSLLGTWIPFALIFTATLLTGLYSRSHAPAASLPRQQNTDLHPMGVERDG
jgi:hypothetical protein